MYKPLPTTAPKLHLKIEQLMLERGFSPKSLSLAAGLNETYVRDLFQRGSTRPRLDGIEKIAVALNCSTSFLLDENNGNFAQGFELSGDFKEIGQTSEYVTLIAFWNMLADEDKALAIRFLKGLMMTRVEETVSAINDIAHGTRPKKREQKKNIASNPTVGKR